MGEWTAAVSIGVRPTFVTGRGLLVEAFLLDFDGDLYGRELRLQFVERIRGEKRFDSAEALIEQMHRDVDEIAPASRLTLWTTVRVFDRASSGVARRSMRVLLAHALTPKRRRIARVLAAAGHEVVEVDEPRRGARALPRVGARRRADPRRVLRRPRVATIKSDPVAYGTAIIMIERPGLLARRHALDGHAPRRPGLPGRAGRRRRGADPRRGRRRAPRSCSRSSSPRARGWRRCCARTR